MNRHSMDNWKSAPLRDLASKIGSGATPRGGEKVYKSTGTPLIRSMNVYFAGFRTKGLVYLDDDQASALNGVTVKAGDILLNITGASIGRVTQAPQEMDGARVNQHVCIIRPTDAIEPGFLARYLASPEIQTFIAGENYGVTRQALTKGMIENISIPLPPLQIQRRIVAELDSLLERSSIACEDLNRIPRLVERYKHAVLASAFRGELTAAFRQDQSTRDYQALAHETAQRRSLYFKKAGIRERPATEPKWTPSISLPKGWGWISVDQLATVVQYGTSAKTTETVGTGVPVMRMGNIADGHLDYSKLKYLPTTHDEFPELLLQDGDILFNRTNSADLVGKTAVYFDEGRSTSFASYLIRVRVIGYLPQLLSAYINSEYGREWVRSVVNQQVGQANVNGTKLKELAVPMIPFKEQTLLWECIKKSFAAIDQLGNETARAHDLLGRLEQATLAKAFRGELLKEQQRTTAELVVSQ